MTVPAAPTIEAVPLNAVWWNVLRPTRVVLATGQPGLEVVHVCDTLAEATHHVRAVPGGVIVVNLVVFVNPQTTPIIRQ